MLSFLPSPLKGLIATLFVILNTVFWCLLIYVFVIFKVLIPIPAFRKWTSRVMASLGENWISVNSFGIALMHRIQWDIQGLNGLNSGRSYLITSNHQSWVDIVVLQHVFNRRIPLIRFFLKQELIYVPFLNGAWWALDFPFMKRFSAEYLAKHPEKRGEDLKTTQRTCERLRGTPITILNFLEGTRFTPEKHSKQKSPFRHLLRPKTGGVGFVIDAMGTQFDSILDVTLFYPEGRPSMWDLLSGQVDQIQVRVERIEIPARFLKQVVGPGAAAETVPEVAIRGEVKNWLLGIWERKDQLIESLNRQSSIPQKPAPPL